MKKKIIIGSIAFTLCFILTGCFFDTTKVTLVDKLDYEVNSQLSLSDLVVNKDDVEIVNGDEKVDTSKLGKKEVIIKYYTKNKKEKYTSLKINVVDTTKPVIEADDNITITLGDNIDLASKASVTDNSNEEIQATIEGDYDFNKASEYNLKYVAVDKSGNKAEKEFKLIVKNIEIRKYGYYVFKRSDSWHEVQLQSNGKFSYDPWWCPGSGCGGGGNTRGTYKVEGNKIIATITEEWPDIGDPNYYNPPRIWTFTINSETQIEMEGQKFNWQRTFEG